jgi:uncharacterized membrane protein YqjE
MKSDRQGRECSQIVARFRNSNLASMFGWTNVFASLELVLVVIDPQLCLHADNASNALLCLASIVLPWNLSSCLEFHDTTDFFFQRTKTEH